jgi:type VI secretion system protein ImpL
MLDDPSHLEKQQLVSIADLEWKTGNPESAAALSAHFAELLNHEDAVRRIPADRDLVAQARRTIRQASLAGLVYRYIRLSYESDAVRSLRLDIASGVGADRVLRRRSGVPLSKPIRAFYTAPVFKEVTAKAMDDLAGQLAAERWVWGDEGAPRVSSNDVRTTFLDLYEKDYIAAWDEILRDIQPVPMASAQSTKDVLASIAGPTSPLRGFLKTVDEHTNLVPAKAAAQPQGGIVRRIEDAFKQGQEAVGSPTMEPGAQVTAHFASIHQLVTGDAGAAPIDGIIRKLDEIQRELGAVGNNVGEANPASAPVVAKLGTMANDLKRDAVALPPAVGGVVAQLADRVLGTVRGGLQGSLASRYNQEVLRECRDVTSGRYPFVPSSTTDVPLADFGRLFGYNGVYDAFFANDLRDLVDTNRTPWAWKTDESGASVGGAFSLSRFESARRIRDIFFRSGSQDPELRFRMTSNYLDAGAQRFLLEIDGQALEDRHGAERAVQAVWPGPSPGSATVTFEERSGKRPNLVTRGPWAWLRLVDAARIDRETDERYVLTFSIEGHEAKISIDALTIRNPYAKQILQQFACS